MVEQAGKIKNSTAFYRMLNFKPGNPNVVVAVSTVIPQKF